MEGDKVTKRNNKTKTGERDNGRTNRQRYWKGWKDMKLK
jgi:hypothetical protein